MKRLLECSGCIVTIAENGKVGLTLLKEQPFDITFMDFLMARLNICTITKATVFKNHIMFLLICIMFPYYLITIARDAGSGCHERLL